MRTPAAISSLSWYGRRVVEDRHTFKLKFLLFSVLMKTICRPNRSTGGLSHFIADLSVGFALTSSHPWQVTPAVCLKGDILNIHMRWHIYTYLLVHAMRIMAASQWTWSPNSVSHQQNTCNARFHCTFAMNMDWTGSGRLNFRSFTSDAILADRE